MSGARTRALSGALAAALALCGARPAAAQPPTAEFVRRMREQAEEARRIVAAQHDSLRTARARTIAALSSTPTGPAAMEQVVRIHYDIGRGHRFEPAHVKVKQGGTVRFVLVSGAPHIVMFDEWPLPGAPPSVAPMLAPNQTASVSLAGVPSGAYLYQCAPHLAARGERGLITVVR
jgi:plastocyanin